MAGNIMKWDELVLLRGEASRIFRRRERPGPEERDRFCDYMEFVLCLIYDYGWKDAEQIVGIVPFKDGLDDKCVNLEIADKTFRERAEEYLRNGTEEDILRLIDTEAHRDYNTGVQEAAEQSGVPGVRKQWHTMLDGRVRDTHDYLEGMKVGLADRFYTFDGDSALYPGGFSDPANNANCRCWVTLSR